MSSTLGWLMAGITIWVFAFFRDPVRAVPQDERAIIAPADGLVTIDSAGAAAAANWAGRTGWAKRR